MLRMLGISMIMLSNFLTHSLCK